MKHIADYRKRLAQSSILRIALLIGAITLLVTVGSVSSLSTQAQEPVYHRTPTQGSPPDAQSTTGPTPPPSVNVVGALAASEMAVSIPDVPAYIWHHGCGPTAAGMVIGYWDSHGFEVLVPGDAYAQTTAVNEMMATEGPASNYTDYCEPLDYYWRDPEPLLDKSEDPPGDEHADDCVADYMKTSQSRYHNYYGWGWFGAVGPAMKNYVDSLGQSDYYVTVSKFYTRRDPYLDWDNFRAEIDAGRPMVLLVDTDGDGGTDHFVTAVGYDVVGDVPQYACLNTWDGEIHWFEFAPIASGQPWGIYGAETFRIVHLDGLDNLIFFPLVLQNY